MSTPMLRQYFDIKKSCPGSILLFRVGDFYETYGEDAEIASRELEIVLTSRDAGKGKKIQMAGVPHHAVDQYIRTLISKGFRLAICDQVEDPKLAKGIVKREVVRIITSGTISDPEMLDSARNNYLMSIGSGRNGYGIAVADISTGEFWATQIEMTGNGSLAEEVSRWQPAEVLLDPYVGEDEGLKKTLERARASYLPWEEVPDETEARKILLEHFKSGTLEGFGLGDSNEAVKAAAVLVKYIRETSKVESSSLKKISVYSAADFMILDSATARNLELTRTLLSGERKGSLLWTLDETVNPMGARLLRSWIERPLVNKNQICERLDAVEELINNFSLALELRKKLGRILDMERLLSKVIYQTANARDLYALRISLENLPAIKDLIKKSKALLLKKIYNDIDLLEDIFDLLNRAIAEDPPLSIREGGIIKKGYDKELDRLRGISSEAKDWVAKLEEKERTRTGIKSLKVGFNQVFGYYIEVTKSNLKNVPSDYIRKQTIANGERFISQELKEYEAQIVGAEEKSKVLEYDLFVKVRDGVGSAAERIQKTSRSLAGLDVLGSFAYKAANNNYSRPVIDESKVISIKGGRHPVVEGVVSGGFTPNDTFVDSESDSFLIITGPNMSGKSTYLRQVALTVLMAQMGSFVPAESAQIGIVDRIFTRVGASDDLHLGQSTFLVEMSEAANILNNSTSRSLVILDEIGRGTSTFDGLSLAWAMAEYIHESIGARSLFATHFHELTQLARIYPGIKNYRVSVKESADEIIFLHKIVPGGTDRSYGIYVAKLAGVPDNVLLRAGEVLEQLEKEKKIGRIKRQERTYEEPDALQLNMFSGQVNPVLEELKALRLSTLTPLEALNKLHEWKKKMDKV